MDIGGNWFNIRNKCGDSVKEGDVVMAEERKSIREEIEEMVKEAEERLSEAREAIEILEKAGEDVRVVKADYERTRRRIERLKEAL